jgi:uncharacterized protein (TIRG00374 family)
MTTRTRKILTTLAKAAVAVFAVTYLLLSGRLDFEQIAGMREWRLAALGTGLLFLIPLIGWFRWWIMLRAQGIRLGLYKAFQIQMIGVFFNSFLFGAVGGDVLKAYYVATGEGKDKKPQAVMTVLLDRVVGTMGLCLILMVAIPFAWSMLGTNRKILTIALILAAAYGGLLAFFVFLAIPRFRANRCAWLTKKSQGRTLRAKLAKALNGTDEAIQQVAKHPLATLLCIVISAAAHLSTITAFYFFGRALGIDDIDFGEYAVLSPIALAVNALPILPAGGAGTGELFASIVFAGAKGAEDWVGGTIMFLWRLSLLIPAPIGLVFFLLHRQDVKRAREAAQAEYGSAGPACE